MIYNTDNQDRNLKKTFNRQAAKASISLLVLSLLFMLSSCKQSGRRFSDEDQQVLDSAYYINYIKTDSKFFTKKAITLSIMLTN